MSLFKSHVSPSLPQLLDANPPHSRGSTLQESTETIPQSAEYIPQLQRPVAWSPNPSLSSSFGGGALNRGEEGADYSLLYYSTAS
ncbi:hypothetical protein Vadar_009001 [Vaccinium darrowii]|uniref:Uncharacterized protein n=1 Tax=Vaccinium darrowii TaxID=229202 RepID=A0ACB7ZA89_9ERIC|nr:hypothetical protein Vadar_009001 [Vaccinium darrowii]